MDEYLTYNEKELLLYVSKGDEIAFTVLFHKHYPKIYQAGLMLTHSHELAEELVQDVFLKIWLKRLLLPGIEDFESYLFIMARNRAYYTLQRQIKLRQITAGISQNMPLYSTETEDYIQNNNYSQLLEQAIRRLPPKQQVVYRLSKIQGMKREAIAAQMHIRPETVKEHLAKAVKNIRAFFMANTEGFTPGLLLLLTCCFKVVCV